MSVPGKHHDYMLRIRDNATYIRVSQEQRLPCNYDKYGEMQCRKIIQQGPGSLIIYCDKPLRITRAKDLVPFKKLLCNARGFEHPIFASTSYIGVCENARCHNDCKPLIICKDCMEKCIGGAPWDHRHDKYQYSSEWKEGVYQYNPKKKYK